MTITGFIWGSHWCRQRLRLFPINPSIITKKAQGYEFSWLRSLNDYVVVGNSLSLCLHQWEPHMNPVIVIYHKGQPLAAIEINGASIVQAKCAGNKSICQNKAVFEIFKKWVARNHLVFNKDL